MDDVLITTAVAALAFIGITISNLMIDRGFDPYVTRRIPAVLGGIAFLMAAQWLSPWNAVLLGSVFTLGISFVHWKKPAAFRGVAGSLREQPWVEITFVSAGTASLLIGLVFSDDKWMAFVPIGFIAWGDTASGVTAEVVRRAGCQGRYWPSLAMFVVCLGVAYLYSPFWIAAVAAIPATFFEWRAPKIFGIRDDN